MAYSNIAVPGADRPEEIPIAVRLNFLARHVRASEHAVRLLTELALGDEPPAFIAWPVPTWANVSAEAR